MCTLFQISHRQSPSRLNPGCCHTSSHRWVVSKAPVFQQALNISPFQGLRRRTIIATQGVALCCPMAPFQGLMNFPFHGICLFISFTAHEPDFFGNVCEIFISFLGLKNWITDVGIQKKSSRLTVYSFKNFFIYPSISSRNFGLDEKKALKGRNKLARGKAPRKRSEIEFKP